MSEGKRGRLVPQEWVLDVRSAVDRLYVHPQVDRSRIALLGWGLGGGVVVAAAGEDERVRAVASCNGIADGYRSTRGMHDDMSWQRLLERLQADRGRRAQLGRSEITSPWDVVRLDLDRRTDGYVGEEIYNTPGFGTGVNLESADFLLRFKPADYATRLAEQALLVVHGSENRLHKLEEGLSLYETSPGKKRLEILDGKGHTEWMFDEDPTFKHMVEVIDQFFHDALGLVA